MKKILPLILLLIFFSNFTFGQISLSLENSTRQIPTNLIGYNGRSTEGPSWTNQSFLNLVQQMQPGTVRYPAGTIGNYWDWRTGNYIENSGKTSDYPFTIQMLIEGLPQETSIIYVANLARPTPFTGISLTASDEILKSNETLQLKINDMLDALNEFEAKGKFPEAIELGNEFYFTNEHAAIYGGNPDLYLVHAKEVSKQIKFKYPDLKILLITTKGGNEGRDFWNNKVFNALNSDAELKSYIYGVVQHHYINESYGNPTQVTNEQTAKVAISEGFTYTRELQSDYDLVPNDLKLWITEFGATKPNAENTWAAGLRAAAMTLGWLEKGAKIESLIYHHITEDPNMINKTNMKLGAVGMAYSLLAKAAWQKNEMQKINITQNPIVVNNVEALHAFKFKNQTQESIFILNIGSTSFSQVNLTNLFTYTGVADISSYWHSSPYISPVYQEKNINFLTNQTDKIIEIKPFSLTVVSVENEQTAVNDLENSELFQIYPTKFSTYFNVKIDTKLLGSKLEIIDVTGKTVYYSMLENENSIHTPQINSGIFIVRIISEHEVISKKILKQNEY